MSSAGLKSLRVVLVGKTGAGKSSLGNALANIKDPDKRFPVGRGMKSKTESCWWKKGEQCGLTVEVIDTPGLCDTKKPENFIYKEIGKSVAVAEPGPHVLIFTLRCDRRFTDEEFQAYQTIKKMFSEEMNKYMILVFNGLDAFNKDGGIAKQREALKDEVQHFDGTLQTLLTEVEGRYFGMNGTVTNAEQEEQIHDLITMMVDLVRKNGNQYYTTPVITEIKKKVDHLIHKYAEERQLSDAQATYEVKQDIVDEQVDLGFFQSIQFIIQLLGRKVTEACRLM